MSRVFYAIQGVSKSAHFMSEHKILTTRRARHSKKSFAFYTMRLRHAVAQSIPTLTWVVE